MYLQVRFSGSSDLEFQGQVVYWNVPLGSTSVGSGRKQVEQSEKLDCCANLMAHSQPNSKALELFLAFSRSTFSGDGSTCITLKAMSH